VLGERSTAQVFLSLSSSAMVSRGCLGAWTASQDGSWVALFSSHTLAHASCLSLPPMDRLREPPRLPRPPPLKGGNTRCLLLTFLSIPSDMRQERWPSDRPTSVVREEIPLPRTALHELVRATRFLLRFAFGLPKMFQHPQTGEFGCPKFIEIVMA
jgi:hypothetical protein